MTQFPQVKIVWTCTDYSRRIVTLSQQQLEHIQDGRFTIEDCDWSLAISRVIENPDMVATGKFEDSEVHSKRSPVETLDGLWLNVHVIYQAGQGDVRTAIPMPGQRSHGKVLYMRPGLWDK